MKLTTKDQIEALANEIFGEKRVFVKETERTNSVVFDIIVHFPTIEITNELKNKHIIKDLYVNTVLSITKDSTHGYIRVMGIRRAFSLKEYESQYSHSHLPKWHNMYGYMWHDFCTGASQFTGVKMNLSTSLEEDDWRIYFYSLQKYLSWESIEGGPYTQINSIAYRSTVPDSELKDKLRTICMDIPTSTFSFFNGCKVIDQHPKLYEHFNVHSSIRKLDKYTPEEKKLKCKEGVSILNRGWRSTNGTPFMFKDKKVRIKITDKEGDNNTLSTDVVDVYCKIITEELNAFNKEKQHEYLRQKNSERVFGKDRAFRLSDTSNIKEITESDKFPA